MHIGADEGTSVSGSYEPPSTFDGTLEWVRFVIAPGSDATKTIDELIERNG